MSRKGSTSGVNAETLAAWVYSAVQEVCDSSSAQIIIQIIKYCNVLSINELLLNLLAKMVGASTDAAQQMIVAPYSHAKKQATKEGAKGKGRGGSSGGEVAEDTRSCLSYVFSVCASNKNREVMMAATADILIGTILAMQDTEEFSKVCDFFKF